MDAYILAGEYLATQPLSQDECALALNRLRKTC